MATKTQSKTKPKTSAKVVNSAGRQYFVAGGSKKNKSTGKKKNTQVATVKKKPATRNKGGFIRNTARDIGNSMLIAIGGALVLIGYNELVNRLPIQIAPAVRIGGKFALGFGVGHFGKRWLGSWAQLIQSALFLVGTYEAITTWVLPYFGGYFTTAEQVATPVAKLSDPNTGAEIGMLYRQPSGQEFEFYYDRAGAGASAGLMA